MYDREPASSSTQWARLDQPTTVIAAGPEYKVLAENLLADGFMASPAIAGKALFLRSKTALYRIEE